MQFVVRTTVNLHLVVKMNIIPNNTSDYTNTITTMFVYTNIISLTVCLFLIEKNTRLKVL